MVGEDYNETQYTKVDDWQGYMDGPNVGGEYVVTEPFLNLQLQMKDITPWGVSFSAMIKIKATFWATFYE